MAKKSNKTATLLLLGGAGLVAYAIYQSQKKTPLLTRGTTYQAPSLLGNVSNLAQGFMSTLKDLFGNKGSISTTGVSGTSPWYDLESAMGKYPMAQYPQFWSYDPVTQQPQFRGAYDIDIALATA